MASFHSRHSDSVGRDTRDGWSGPSAADVLRQAREEYGPERLDARKLATTYESMLDSVRRLREGIVYTPGPVAAFTTTLLLGQVVKELGPGPEQILRISLLDPACGVGVFLVEGARQLARVYAHRLAGQEPDPHLIQAVLPTVILHCCFGIDIDPVAVELAKLSLCLETGGLLPAAALDRHIIHANPLNGPDVHPPAWHDKRAAATTIDLTQQPTS